VKYKNLKSFAHNFVHSFVSFTNYFDDGYVIDDLREAARKPHEGPISINWIPETLPNKELLSERVLNSISHFRSWLPEHAKNHEVELEHVREFRLEIYRLSSHQLRIDAVIVDDRSHEHRQSVQF
jgi:hypothetical protein